MYVFAFLFFLLSLLLYFFPIKVSCILAVNGIWVGVEFLDGLDHAHVALQHLHPFEIRPQEAKVATASGHQLKDNTLFGERTGFQDDFEIFLQPKVKLPIDGGVFVRSI